MSRQKRVGAPTVEIVGVDDGKGLSYHVTCRAQGVCRSPRLNPSFGHTESLRHVVKSLKGVLDVDLVLKAGADGLAEVRKILFLDDENNFVKARTNCIMHRKIDDELPLFRHGCQLLQSAIAGAEACR